uniref:N-acetyltransferase domain-containing protein n=1 Tax=Glossina brevipalpis TaxID=37001 RepID=A0A1A9WXM9_9MUSC
MTVEECVTKEYKCILNSANSKTHFISSNQCLNEWDDKCEDSPKYQHVFYQFTCSCITDTTNELIEIASSQWEKLRNLYGNKRIYSCSYNLLQTLIDCVKQNENFKVSIYSLNGDWETDGTFIAKFYNQIYCNTLSDNFQRLLDILNCLDNTQEYWVSGYQERFSSTVKQHFLLCGLLENEFKEEGTFWYHLPIEEALAFQDKAPHHLNLRHLEETHADQVNSVWPHRQPGSLEYVKLLIQCFDSVGVFDEGNNLIAWCLVAPLGCLSLLQVIDSHKRQGLGQLAVRYMSSLLARKGLEVTAPVVFNNIASRSLFEKMGFKVVDKKI